MSEQAFFCKKTTTKNACFHAIRPVQKIVKQVFFADNVFSSAFTLSPAASSVMQLSNIETMDDAGKKNPQVDVLRFVPSHPTSSIIQRLITKLAYKSPSRSKRVEN